MYSRAWIHGPLDGDNARCLKKVKPLLYWKNLNSVSDTFNIIDTNASLH